MDAYTGYPRLWKDSGNSSTQNNNNYQKFILENAGNGNYRIKSVIYNNYLTVSYAGTTNEKIIQSSYSTSNDQIWSFENVAATSNYLYHSDQMANGIDRTSPLEFWVVSGFSSNTKSLINKSMEKWNNTTSTTKVFFKNFNTFTTDESYNSQLNLADGYCDISYGDRGPMDDDTYVAQVIISRDYNTKKILEADMDINTTWDAERVLGDASVNPQAVDIEEILTHEFGHAGGLADIKTRNDGANTMYGNIRKGSILKRTLGIGEITGFNTYNK